MLNLIISIVIHSVVALVLLSTPAEIKDLRSCKRLGGRTESDKVIPKPIEYTIVSRVSGGVGSKPKKSKNKTECKKFYGGVGVQSSYINEQIVSVYPGYPADRAGIKVGDVVLNPMDLVRGKIGTTVKLQIKNDSGIVVYNLIREKICIE